MNSKSRSSPRTRTPLRKESSYESTRTINTPPLLNADFEELSPLNFHARQLDGIFHEDFRHLKNYDNSNESELQPNLLSTKPLTREDRFRNLRQDAMNDFLSGTACFIGEKLMVATESMNDIYHIALSFYQQQQYERALDILNTKKTINKSVRCRYLAALCSLALENGRDALDYLGHKNPFSGKELVQDDSSEGLIKLESCLCYARGKAYLLLKDIENARECFKEALTVDVKCYDALEALVKYNMMDENTEWSFVMTLPYEEHCGLDADYFRYLYGLKLKRDILNGTRMDSDTENIAKSLDVQLSIAEGYFSECRYEDCLKICIEMKKQDSYFKESIPLHLSCLYELGMKNELFEYAQELVSRLNNEAVSWHAVGLYYLYIKKNLDARRYFNQALTINQFFQQSWLGYGHSFSAEKDYDQAISAYMTCSRLIPGSYLPLMNIAMQYMAQNKMNLAFEYFKKSLQKNNYDPFLYNELAVYYYKQEMYKEAKDNLHTALKLSKKHQYQKSIIWEKIWCNLGHVYRHPPLRNDDRALKCFENALSRNPTNSDARAVMGMIYQLKGNTAQAIAEYHEALKNTDVGGLINELLDMALLTNLNTKYETKNRYLDDGFDILQVSDFVRETKDEVEIELDENYWLENKISQLRDKVPILSFNKEDDLIIDEGDLRPSMSKEWI